MAKKIDFVHLHNHSDYSLLDGSIKPARMLARAQELGMGALALTDHGNLFGAIDFYKSAKKIGIKPIVGCEIYLAYGDMRVREKPLNLPNYSHLTVLAMDFGGYQNLVKMMTAAHLDGFYSKPRVDMDCLRRHNKGLIILSGCLQGEINYHIRQDNLPAAEKKISEFIEIFGRERFFLELHDHGIADEHKCNRQLILFAQKFGLDLVAANDTHFLCAEDYDAHDALLCIGTGKKIIDQNRMHYPDSLYLKTPAEMAALFSEVPTALTSSVKIAEMCNLEIELDATSIAKYPQFDAPDGSPRREFFEKLCWQGLRQKYGDRADSDDDLKKRLQYEMDLIEKLGFSSYFLIIWDFISWAKKRGIPVGPGRGSAAGSVVAYCLEIIDIDPLRFGLIFERFLNPERVSPPDIDIDFCQSRRGEVIEYVRQKYGERCVSHIITFGKMRAKNAVRDVGRVMGLSYGEADRIAKMIPNDLGITLAKAEEQNPELKTALEQEPQTAELWQTAKILEGNTRNAGVHAAGIVIGDRPLDEFVPLTRGSEGEIVTQYSMSPLTDLGMLKMDFLGLKTLTVIDATCKLICEHSPDFQIDNQNFDDEKTFALLQRGETMGVFQLESGGMTSYAKQMQIDRLEDIIALSALYRPGPMENIPDYIARKLGKKKVKYLHPLLEEVSRETYGVLIYQEQVQKAANLLAGYSLGEADILRRAMGKKDPAVMKEQREIFVNGCAKNNKIPEKKANAIFDLLEKFAGYGFNKSHSAAYGIVSYQTAFLKANYPVEFMAALLTSEMGNTDKVTLLSAECQRMGIYILPPQVNESQIFFSVAKSASKSALHYGLAAVKNVGEAALQGIISEREQNGKFASLIDFVRRVPSKSCNRKILESLIKVGAFDDVEPNRAMLFSQVDAVLAVAQAEQKERDQGATMLFGEEVFAEMLPPALSESGANVADWSKGEKLAYEKELLGIYISGHPLDEYRALFAKDKGQGLLELEKIELKTKASFIAMITACDVRYARSSNLPFAILRFEDFYTSAAGVLLTKTFAQFGKNLAVGMVCRLEGKVELDSISEEKRLNLSSVKIIPRPSNNGENSTPEQQSQSIQAVQIALKLADFDEPKLRDLAALLYHHHGSSPVELILHGKNHSTAIAVGSKFTIKTSDQLRDKLADFGAEIIAK